MSETSESRHDSVLSFSRGETLLMLWPTRGPTHNTLRRSRTPYMDTPEPSSSDHFTDSDL